MDQKYKIISLRILIGLVTALFLVSIALWVDAYQSLVVTTQNTLRLQRLTAEIALLGNAQTVATSTAFLVDDVSSRQHEHDSTAALLHIAFNESAQRVPEAQELFVRIRDEREALNLMEEHIFYLLGEGRITEARDIILSDEYNEKTAIYQQDTTAAITLINARITQTHDALRYEVSFASIFGLIFVGSVALFFINLTRKISTTEQRALHLLAVSEEEREKNVQLSERLRIATRSAHIGVWTWDIAKDVVTWDKEMHQLYNMGHKQFHGGRAIWMEYVHPEDRPMVARAVNHAVEHATVLDIVFRVVSKEVVRYMKSYGTVQYDANNIPTEVVGVSMDITKEKELDQLKDEFVSIASHELRTPMTVVREYATLLIGGEFGKVTKRQQEYLMRIKNNITRLISMINDMLDINKLEARRMDFTPEQFTVGDLVHGVMADFVELYAKKNLYLEMAIDDVARVDMYGDQEKVARVVTNLLSNAYKFTPENGRVTIGAEIFGDDERFVRVFVRDTGVGIKPEAQKVIFEKFSQADNVLQRDIEGTGLGLAISKMIIERHGGTIWVDSVVDHGSTFSFTVPRRKLE